MIKQNDNFNAVISMEVIGKLSAIGFDIEYDSTALEYQGHELNQVFTSEVINQNIERPNIISIGLNNVSGYFENRTEPELFKIKFKALAAGETLIKFVPGEILLDDDEITELVEQTWNDTTMTIEKMNEVVKLVMRILIEEISAGAV